MTVEIYCAEQGSVSSGTMRPEDLIPRLSQELDDLKDEMLAHYSTSLAAFEQVSDAKARAAGIDTLLKEINGRKRSNPLYYTSEDVSWDVDELFTSLDEFSPDGCYFGGHPGDGCDYGFWQYGEDEVL